MKLNSHDTRLLLRVVEELNSDFDPDTLPQRALRAASQLVSSDCTSFDFFSHEGKYNTTAWNDRPDAVTPENMAVFGRYVHQHALIPVALARTDGKAMKMTDVISQTDFERSELYNEFYRGLKFKRQMGMAMPVTGDLKVACVYTHGGDDFSERDRSMLTLAGPHLLNAMRNALAYERLSGAMETGGFGLISIDTQGTRSYTSKLASDLLERYFPGEKRDAHSLPEMLSRWMSRATSPRPGDEIKMPAAPLRVQNERGTLTFRLIENRRRHEMTLLLEEEWALPASVVVNGFELTRRETEVLFWIKNGKTNAVIAELCGISMRTVHKHVEHIYAKLGVETRTAAMLRGMELL